MDFDQYNKKTEEAVKQYDLDRLREQIIEDGDLTNNEVNSLLLRIHEKGYDLNREDGEKTEGAEGTEDLYYPDEDLEIEVTLPDVVTELKGDKSYGDFLASEYFPRFHPMKDSSMYKVAAAFALFNSAAIPTNRGLSIPLPIAYIYGQSGSGKSMLANAFAAHYPPRCVGIIVPTGSPTTLRDTPHNICQVEGRFRPSLLVLDNFYASSPSYLGQHFFNLLSWEKQSAFTRVTQQGQMQIRYTWCTKVITSTDSLREIGNNVVELRRRALPLPTSKFQPRESLYQWSREKMKEEYFELWSRNNIGKWKESLSRVLSNLDKVSSYISEDKIPASLLPISVMLFSGIEDSLENSIKTMREYWEFTDEEQKFSLSRMERICTDFLDTVVQKRRSLAERLQYSDDFWKYIPATDIWDHIQNSDSSISKNNSNWKELEAIMGENGFRLQYTNKRLFFVKEQ